MNIPDGWLAAIGAAFATAMGVLWGFFHKHLDRYIAGLKEDIAELKEKQAQCEAASLDLTDRVARMEGERDGFMSGVEYTANKFQRDVVEDIVARLGKD